MALNGEGGTWASLKAGVNGESGPSDSEALCNFCKCIFDFGSVGVKFVRRPLSVRDRPVRLILDKSKSCVFCREVAKFYIEWKDGKVDDDLVGIPGQFLGNNWVEYSLHEQKGLANVIEEPSLNRIRVLFQRNAEKYPDSYNDSRPLLQFQYCSQPPLRVSAGGSLCEWKECAPEQAYSGRIRPLLADTRLFLEWKKTCCAKHGDPCNLSSTGTRPTWLRLIDVTERCVKDIVIKDDSSYVALSYVWGKQELGQKLMPLLGNSTENQFRKPMSLTRETVLSTIHDAIEVTKCLGEQYLWVDCLCIKQDDSADQGKFILQMDSIYAYASVTIVAASGGNADAGLPGISESRNNEQEPFKIHGSGVSLLRTLDPVKTTKELTISDDYWYLETSVWCERGWTFQEKLFSRRALIFTEEQVYWECQKATWCEDGFWETMQPPTFSRPCFSKDIRRPWASDNQEAFEKIYVNLVQEYCRRKLTNGSDGLDAFRGILNALEREAGQGFLSALPTSSLSKMLTWWCTERSVKRREEMCPVRLSDGNEGMAGHFCPFSSWSWVGWTSVVELGFISATSDLIFYYLDGERHLRKVEEVSSKSRSRDEEGLNREITLPEIPEIVRSQSVDRNILFFKSTTAKLHVRHEGFDDFKLEKLILSYNNEDVQCSWFHVPDLKQGDKEVCDFVVIGNETDSRTCIMLVIYKKGVAYRRGLASLDATFWKRLQSPNLKLICLG
ncbi:hypothetical protein KC19_6G136600 [Ceratodon purpureus]|uniref:Heterokaryon incompatibility domain-containing protein n=1 Tax=Ceratodon purpureus TaxID=3225 RepID=A0A8T0HE82_CERPU|nr:hypothetical protein KC19_6G136600 [Ceratodon purpureus]KAG0570073.1 hypothetical protein KC19_6G136600 [Ceratodon purpureus]